MKRLWWRWCLICTFTLSALAANAASTPAFWRAKSSTSTLFLLGSMHFGTEAFYPLDREIELAFASADTLVVEVDVTRIAPAQAIAAITRHGRLGEDKTLAEVLNPNTLQALKSQAGNVGIPFAALQRFAPWFAALQIVEAEIRRTGFRQEYGVDQYFLKRANDKRIVQLETLDAQLGIFSSLSLPEQEAFLMQTLRDLGESQRYLESLAQAWQRGDTERLQVTLIAPFKENPQAAELYQAIFIERNKRMAQRASELLQGGDTVFLVVGAGHLLGETGLVSQLRRMGYDCDRLQLAQQGKQFSR